MEQRTWKLQEEMIILICFWYTSLHHYWVFCWLDSLLVASWVADPKDPNDKQKQSSSWLMKRLTLISNGDLKTIELSLASCIIFWVVRHTLWIPPDTCWLATIHPKYPHRFLKLAQGAFKVYKLLLFSSGHSIVKCLKEVNLKYRPKQLHPVIYINRKYGMEVLNQLQSAVQIWGYSRVTAGCAKIYFILMGFHFDKWKEYIGHLNFFTLDN